MHKLESQLARYCSMHRSALHSGSCLNVSPLLVKVDSQTRLGTVMQTAWGFYGSLKGSHVPALLHPPAAYQIDSEGQSCLMLNCAAATVGSLLDAIHACKSCLMHKHAVPANSCT